MLAVRRCPPPGAAVWFVASAKAPTAPIVEGDATMSGMSRFGGQAQEVQAFRTALRAAETPAVAVSMNLPAILRTYLASSPELNGYIVSHTTLEDGAIAGVKVDDVEISGSLPDFFTDEFAAPGRIDVTVRGRLSWAKVSVVPPGRRETIGSGLPDDFTATYNFTVAWNGTCPSTDPHP